jgi:hypothetical protein
LNHEAAEKRKTSDGGERSITDRHNMSDTVIGETTTIGMTDMIGTGSIMDGTKDTTGITPPVTTNDGKTTVDMTTSPGKGTETKRLLIRNDISRKGVTHGNRRKAPQAANRIKAPQLPQVLHQVQEITPNLATPERHTATIVGKKDTIVTNARQRATISDRR